MLSLYTSHALTKSVAYIKDQVNSVFCPLSESDLNREKSPQHSNKSYQKALKDVEDGQASYEIDQ